jgi:hypothetical protein
MELWRGLLHSENVSHAPLKEAAASTKVRRQEGASLGFGSMIALPWL